MRRIISLRPCGACQERTIISVASLALVAQGAEVCCNHCLPGQLAQVARRTGVRLTQGQAQALLKQWLVRHEVRKDLLARRQGSDDSRRPAHCE
jgi:hypothetical protein